MDFLIVQLRRRRKVPHDLGGYQANSFILKLSYCNILNGLDKVGLCDNLLGLWVIHQLRHQEFKGVREGLHLLFHFLLAGEIVLGDNVDNFLQESFLNDSILEEGTVNRSGLDDVNNPHEPELSPESVLVAETL